MNRYEAYLTTQPLTREYKIGDVLTYEEAFVVAEQLVFINGLYLRSWPDYVRYYRHRRFRVVPPTKDDTINPFVLVDVI